MTQLYRNSRAGRVRMLQILFWAATLGFAALAVTGFRSGPNPNSWVVGAILAPLFACCAFGIELYLRRYVTLLEATKTGLMVETLSTHGRARKVVPWADVEDAEEREEVFQGGGGPSIDNASSLLRVRGGPRLIIDTTADRFESSRLQSLRRKRSKE